MSAQKGRISEMRRGRNPAADHDQDARSRHGGSERGRRVHHSAERHTNVEYQSFRLPRQHSTEDLHRSASDEAATPNISNLKRWQSEEQVRRHPSSLKKSVSSLDMELSGSASKNGLAQLQLHYGNENWKNRMANRVQQLREEGGKGPPASTGDDSSVGSSSLTRVSSFRTHHTAKQNPIFSASMNQLPDPRNSHQMEQVEQELHEWEKRIKETDELEQRVLRLDWQLQSWREVKANLKAEVACRIRETEEGLRGLETLLETTSAMLDREKSVTEMASTRQGKAYEELARVQEKAYWVHEHARDLEMRLGKQRDEVSAELCRELRARAEHRAEHQSSTTLQHHTAKQSALRFALSQLQCGCATPCQRGPTARLHSHSVQHAYTPGCLACPHKLSLSLSV